MLLTMCYVNVLSYMTEKKMKTNLIKIKFALSIVLCLVLAISAFTIVFLVAEYSGHQNSGEHVGVEPHEGLPV